MKLILNLSLALMLIAGCAGAVDFYTMYRSGEIENLYQAKLPVAGSAKKEHKVSFAVPDTQAAVPATASFKNLTENLSEIELDAKSFSRSEEIYIDEEELIPVEEVAGMDTQPLEELPVSVSAPHVYQVAVADYNAEETQQEIIDTIAGGK